MNEKNFFFLMLIIHIIAAYVNIVHQMKSHSIIPTALEIDPEHAQQEWEQRKEEMEHAMGFMICYNR